MLEIFAIPYFALTAVIIWAVFEPFFRAAHSESLSLTNITITDLLAISLPVGVLCLAAKWLIPASILTLSVQVIVSLVAFLFAAFALTAGLFLLPKHFQVTFLKRMAVVAIIAPAGIFLTIGWAGLLIWACTYSIVFSVPSSLAIVAVTFGLRILGLWVCQAEPEVAENTGSQPDL